MTQAIISTSAGAFEGIVRKHRQEVAAGERITRLQSIRPTTPENYLAIDPTERPFAALNILSATKGVGAYKIPEVDPSPDARRIHYSRSSDQDCTAYVNLETDEDEITLEAAVAAVQVTTLHKSSMVPVRMGSTRQRRRVYEEYNDTLQIWARAKSLDKDIETTLFSSVGAVVFGRLDFTIEQVRSVRTEEFQHTREQILQTVDLVAMHLLRQPENIPAVDYQI